MKWTNRGHEFDKIGENFKNKQLIFYDMAEDTYHLFNRLQRINNNLIAAIVVDGDKSDEEICGVKTITKLEFASMPVDNYIVVLCCTNAANYRAQAHRQAINLGYKDGESLFYYDTFEYYYLPIFLYYSLGILYFKTLNMVITTVCNLNCKGCLNYTSYNSNKHSFTLEELKRNVDVVFNRVDFTGLFLISGGEPFLHKDIIPLVDYIGEKYRKNILRLSIVTNGTIIPSEELVKCLKRNNVYVQIDDYGRSIESLSKASDIEYILNDYGIKCEVLRVPYWINMDPVDEDGVDILAKVNACNVPFTGTKSGRLFGCTYNQFAIEAGLISVDNLDNESLDLEKISDKRTILEMQMGYSPNGFWEFCKMCPGHEWMNNDSIVPGQQLGK
ncbi:MAG: radical SAM protein [Pseudobutyrivibrio ruminis]|uniref:Radical SAM protein n=1 Tax=Pseudobutyrivibrio ruminis TaxID=46206 RepID=A0A927U9L1_9FIRM|nr:radical SAM protein [Pseudobutyrivibrio ruminis]